MPPEVCPLLGTLDDTNNPCPPVEYPSFENHCLVSDDRDTLLLADQASYCLSGGHVVCPRYQIASAARRGARVDPRVAAELTGGALVSDQLRPELMASAMDGDERAASRRWAWLGTGVIFITLMLCGSVFAVWSGWQQVQGYLAERTEGTVASIAALGSDQPAYVIITATPDPLVVAVVPVAAAPQSAAPAAQQAVDPAPGSAQQVAPVGSGAQQFPLAVTATPASAQQSNALVQPPQVAIAPVDPDQARGGVQTDNSQDPPNILLEVPTRRATPVFDIPTSTVAAESPTDTPTSTPTPTPMGTPSVIFGPAQQLVPDGGCTMISWQVLNVREVYYENIGVDGRGQAEECVDDVLEVYHLVVVFPDGASKTYTTTVTMLRPTFTPVPTATFTPFVPNTPTWTPQPPTATPTPVVKYGVLINVNGSTQQSCAPGTTCTFNLVIMNTGDQVDTLFVSINDSGSWSAQLCRGDGVCAVKNLALSNMGSGNTANVSLQVFVPTDASGSERYGVVAASGGSNGEATSGVTTLEVTVQ